MQLLISKGGVKIIVERVQNLQSKIVKNSEGDNSKYFLLLTEVISIAKRMYVYLDNLPPPSEDNLGMGIKGK